MKNTFSALVFSCLVVAPGCGGATMEGTDAGRDTGNGAIDTGMGMLDTGPAVDTGVRTDTGTVTPDTGVRADTGVMATDTGVRDTGTMSSDTGVRDTGVTTDTGVCMPRTTDTTAINRNCLGMPGVCPAFYTCQDMPGFVAAAECEILCVANCDCPGGLTCQMRSAKGVTWRQCEATPTP